MSSIFDWTPQISPTFRLECIKLSDTAVLPRRATPYSAAYDLFPAESRTIFHEDGIVKIPLNLKIRIPHGFWGKIETRSGSHFRVGFTTGAGVIDSDYRGDVMVMGHFIKNDGKLELSPNVAIAQLVIHKVYDFDVVEVTSFDEKETPSHVGFGSTDATNLNRAVGG